MISFFVKKSEVVVDCFTHHESAYEYTPINYGTQFYPDWWKKTDNNFINEKGESKSTIKNCVGFIDYYKNCLVIPSWFEMDLSVYEQGNQQWWNYQASNLYVDTKASHAREAFEGFALDNGNNVKLTSPWVIQTKEEIQWVWSQPTWNLREHLSTFTILPAVVDFKYQHSTNINLFVTNEEKLKNTVIKPNTPLVALHPMTEKNIIIKKHLVTHEEYIQRVDGVASLFLRRNSIDFSKLYKKKKEFLTQKENPSTCPFHKK